MNVLSSSKIINASKWSAFLYINLLLWQIYAWLRRIRQHSATTTWKSLSSKRYTLISYAWNGYVLHSTYTKVNSTQVTLIHKRRAENPVSKVLMLMRKSGIFTYMSHLSIHAFILFWLRLRIFLTSHQPSRSAYMASAYTERILYFLLSILYIFVNFFLCSMIWYI